MFSSTFPLINSSFVMLNIAKYRWKWYCWFLFVFSLIHPHAAHCQTTIGATQVSTPQVWIIGDSIVHWAALLAKERNTWNLGLPVKITWRGKRGLSLGGLRDYVSTFRGKMGSPSLIILHVGTNDIGKLPKKQMLMAVADAVYGMSRVFPSARIIWSDILPRVTYDNFPLGKQNIPDKVRRAANKYARSTSKRTNGTSIPHPQITYTRSDLFYRDGVHLLDKGTDIFMDDIRKGLCALIN